jgi:hypothetical protein
MLYLVGFGIRMGNCIRQTNGMTLSMGRTKTRKGLGEMRGVVGSKVRCFPFL